MRALVPLGPLSPAVWKQTLGMGLSGLAYS